MKWLITGGAGFIGINLIRELLQTDGNTIRVFDDLSVGTFEALAEIARVIELDDSDSSWLSDDTGQIQLVRASILDEDRIAKAAAGFDVIVHLAANTGVAPSVANPRADCMANVVGTLNCLEAARHGGVKRFIFASSGAPVGDVDPPLNENSIPKPISPYGASKLAGEGYCSAYYRTFGVETVALRFSNVYGPHSGHKNSIVAAFISRALAGKVCEIYGDGEQTRDFLYIGDLIGAISKAVAAKNIGGEIFQIATGIETSVNQLAGMLDQSLSVCGHAMKIEHLASRVGDAHRNYAEVEKARKKLGWSAEVKIEEGLNATVKWFHDEMDAN
ncbi:MAG: NAD-dependent epimerase/dehydratase family protein [Rhodospirillales bacterium]